MGFGNFWFLEMLMQLLGKDKLDRVLGACIVGLQLFVLFKYKKMQVIALVFVINSLPWKEWLVFILISTKKHCIEFVS